MRDRCGKLDISEPISANALLCDFNTTAVTYQPFVFNPFILTTVTLPILLWSKDSLTEETLRFRTKGAVVNSLRLLDLATTTCPFLGADKRVIHCLGGIPTFATGLLRLIFNLIGRGYLYGDAVKCRVHQFSFILAASSQQSVKKPSARKPLC